MKKLLAIVAFFALVQTNLNAQFVYGVRIGGSTPDLKANQANVITADTLRFRLQQASYGIHGGIWGRINIGPIFLQPEILFNSASTNYSVTSTRRVIADSLKKETFNNLDIPLFIGFKTSILRVQAAPVGHLNLGSSSQIVDAFRAYKQTLAAMKWGYQVGIGLDLGSHLSLDLRYEGNFYKYGDHITVSGTQYDFGRNPTRTLLSIGYKF